ncbi:putative chitinase 3 [Folsomia candida]|uniref:Putative chitinase 3 n=1 Tax=Folsomia candida TaxID=158441 RepID=A0A226EFC7_FOLCA|nr:putative chitinase 3 [Folsomia candida]
MVKINPCFFVFLVFVTTPLVFSCDHMGLGQIPVGRFLNSVEDVQTWEACCDSCTDNIDCTAFLFYDNDTCNHWEHTGWFNANEYFFHPGEAKEAVTTTTPTTIEPTDETTEDVMEQTSDETTPQTSTQTTSLTSSPTTPLTSAPTTPQTTTTITTTPSTTTTVLTSTSSSNPCQGEADYTYVPHPYDCSKYLICVGNEGIERDCADSLHFDSITLTCTFPELATCLVTSTTTAETTTMVISSSTGGSVVECPAEGVWNIPHESM